MREAHFFVIFLFCGEISCGLLGNPGKTACAKSTLPPCDEDRLIAFLAEIQVLNPESIVEWAIDNLEPLCRSICTNLKKIDVYLQSCTAPNQEDLYMSLIAGVNKLREKLCTESEFIKRYSIYYPCLHELRNDFEACNGPADWVEDIDKEEMCKAYKNIADCYYIKAAKVCGYDAATTIKDLMKDVIDTVVKVKCTSVNRNPYVRDPMPESYIRRSEAEPAYTCSKVIIFIGILMIYLNNLF